MDETTVSGKMNYDRTRRENLVRGGRTSVPSAPVVRASTRPSIRTCPHCTINADNFRSRKAFNDHVEICDA